MAHSASLKAACRAAYIDNMPLTQIAKAQNVPPGHPAQLEAPRAGAG